MGCTDTGQECWLAVSLLLSSCPDLSGLGEAVLLRRAACLHIKIQHASLGALSCVASKASADL